MMNDEDYVWYTDEKGKLRSVGYPIENMFKEAGIPAITGGRNIFSANSEEEGSLAIPAGLVYMHSLVSKDHPFKGVGEEQTEIIPSDLYSQLLNLASDYDVTAKVKVSIKSRKKRYKSNKKKTRKKR
jgi:hypothetical protein